VCAHSHDPERHLAAHTQLINQGDFVGDAETEVRGFNPTNGDAPGTLYSVNTCDMKAPQHIPLTTERREHHSDQRALRDRLELRLEQLWGDSLNATPDGHNHHPVVDRSMRLQKHKRENSADGTDPPATQDEQQQRLPTTVSLEMLAPILAAFGCLEGTVMQEWVKQLGELRQGDIPKEEYLSFDTDDIKVIH
jgi:hypothetical protein